MSDSLKEKLLFLVILIMAMHTLMVQALMPLNGDVAFLLNMAKNTGLSHFYRDFYEVNPPLIVYIYKVFLLPFNFGYISDISSLRVGVIVYLLLSITITWFNTDIFSINKRIFLVFSLALSLFTVSQSVYGQREHLIAAGLVVYLSNILRSREGKPFELSSLVSLFMVAISICLKPQYCLVLVVAEIYSVVKQRGIVRWKEIATVFLVGLIYLYVVVAYQSEYLDVIVPLASIYYSVNFANLFEVILTASVVFLVLMIPYFVVRKTMEDNDLVFLVFLFFVASLGAFVAGRTAFGYHLIPTLTFSFCLVYMAIILQLRQIKREPSFRNVALLLVAFIPIVTFQHKDIFRNYQVDYNVAWNQFISNKQNLSKELFVEPEVLRLSQLVDRHATRGDNIIFIASTSMYPHHTIPIHSGLISLAKQPNYWMLPLAVKNRQDDKHRKVLKFVQQTTVNDMNRYQPELLVVHQREKTDKRYGETDLFHVLLEDIEFRNIFSNYVKVEQSKVKTTIFEVYIRKKQ
ncbi:hypothetical protein ACE1OE_14795 [Vibrio sp. E150_011]